MNAGPYSHGGYESGPAAPRFYGTTILAVRDGNDLAMGGDGQVTLGDSVVKGDACKIRRLYQGRVIAGFAGTVADSFALLERFEEKLESTHGNLVKAATELSRDWRTDRVLRRLESMLAVGDRENLLLLSGNGEVIQPSDGIVAIGSGGNVALAAARALRAETDLPPGKVVERALAVAGEICIYTNQHVSVEVLS